MLQSFKIGLIFCCVIEIVTIICGVFWGSSEKFSNEYQLPLLLRIHHGIHGIFLMILALLLFYKKNNIFNWIMGIGLGLFLSDVIHHLLIAPILYGEMRWHWP